MLVNLDDEDNVILTKRKFAMLVPKKYDENSCPICLNEFTFHENITILECNHGFCSICIDAHRKKSQAKTYLCPLCKSKSETSK